MWDFRNKCLAKEVLDVLGIDESLILSVVPVFGEQGRLGSKAAAIVEQSPIPSMVKERYSSFDSGEGRAFEYGKLCLEDVVDYARRNGEPHQVSGRQELYETLVNLYSI